MKAIVCAIVSGALFYLALGLNDAWYLTWLAPAPLLWLAYGDEPRWRVAAASFAAAVAGQIYVFQCYGKFASPPLLASVFGLPVFLLPVAVLVAGFVYRRAGPLAALLAFPCAWTAAEYAVGLISPHGSYDSIAYSQTSAPIMLQSASLLGLYSITFMLCVAANGVALTARGGSRGLIAAALATGLCVADLAFGAWRLAAPQATPVRVAAVDDAAPMIAAYRTDTKDSAIKIAHAYAPAISDLSAKGAKLVVTPETALISRGPWRAEVLAPLAVAARPTNTLVVAGLLDRSPPGDLAVALKPDGETLVYSKRHLIPVLEADFKPGHGPGLIGGGYAMVVCKDMDFPATLRDDARAGDIRILAVPANDFVTDAWLHARIAILRGVENGFAIVRSANQGVMTVSDAQGRVIARQSTTDPKRLVEVMADVSPGPGATLYTQIGDVLPWGSALAMAGLWLLAFTKRKPANHAGG